MQKSQHSNRRMVALKLHILCIGVITRTGGYSPTPNSYYWVWTQPPHLQGVVS